jgi:hypothetical protein
MAAAGEMLLAAETRVIGPGGLSWGLLEAADQPPTPLTHPHSPVRDCAERTEEAWHATLPEVQMCACIRGEERMAAGSPHAARMRALARSGHHPLFCPFPSPGGRLRASQHGSVISRSHAVWREMQRMHQHAEQVQTGRAS